MPLLVSQPHFRFTLPFAECGMGDWLTWMEISLQPWSSFLNDQLSKLDLLWVPFLCDYRETRYSGILSLEIKNPWAHWITILVQKEGEKESREEGDLFFKRTIQAHREKELCSGLLGSAKAQSLTKISPLSNMGIMGVINHFLLGFKACSMR